MTCRKRVLASFLCGLYFMASVLSSYVTAYATAIPATYSAWEVLQMILLSLGVTVEVTASDLAQDVVSDITGTFEMWMKQNGFDDAEQTRKDLEMIIETGKNGIVNVSQNVWDKIKSWVSSIVSAGAEDAYLETLEKITGGGKGRVESLETIINRYAKSHSVLIPFDGIYNNGNIVFIYTTTSPVGSIDWYYSDWYKEWCFACGTSIDIWNYYKYVYNAEYDEYVLDWYANVGREFRVKTDGGRDELPFLSNYCYYVPQGMAISDALAPDVYFPEQNLAYDICGIPGIQVDELLESGTYDVVTPGRTWDGTDVAGDVILTFPEELGKDVIFQDLIDSVIAGDIPYTDVLVDVGAIPVDKTKDETLVGGNSIAGAIVDAGIDNAPSIEDSKEETNPDGTLTQTTVPMTFDLKKLFPFCIPFDIIDFISVLSAKPVAPAIKYPLKYPTRNGMATYEIDIDLSMFDEVAKLLRTMETIVFIVGLAGITRNHMIRG